MIDNTYLFRKEPYEPPLYILDCRGIRQRTMETQTNTHAQALGKPLYSTPAGPRFRSASVPTAGSDTGTGADSVTREYEEVSPLRRNPFNVLFACDFPHRPPKGTPIIRRDNRVGYIVKTWYSKAHQTDWVAVRFLDPTIIVGMPKSEADKWQQLTAA